MIEGEKDEAACCSHETEETNDVRVIDLEIPADAQSGDVLTFVVDHVEMEVTIPRGSTRGDILQVQLAAATPATSSSEPLLVELSNGALLQLHSSLPPPHDEYPTHHNDATLQTQQMTMSYTVDGTHAMAWPAGIYLARFLTSNHCLDSPLLLHGMRGMELGSGLGTAGLALAVSCKHVVLTDLPEALPLLRYNIHAQTTDVNNVTVRSLIWGDSCVDEKERTNVIVGADLLYNTDLYYDLSRTMNSYLSEEDGMIILAVRWRKPQDERCFFEIMVREFAIVFELATTPPPGRSNTQYGGGCCLTWHEYGNPNSVASNHYFATTIVPVNGTNVCLGEITEQDWSLMSDGDYENFEQTQLQIYIGRRQPKK